MAVVTSVHKVSIVCSRDSEPVITTQQSHCNHIISIASSFGRQQLNSHSLVMPFVHMHIYSVSGITEETKSEESYSRAETLTWCTDANLAILWSLHKIICSFAFKKRCTPRRMHIAPRSATRK